jgi:hypothetical protein
MATFEIDNVNGSVPTATLAADPSRNPKKLKTYKVFVLLTHCGEPPQLRILKIAAGGRLDHASWLTISYSASRRGNWKQSQPLHTK